MSGVKRAAMGAAVLLAAPAAASVLNLDAMPVCVVEAFNKFENGPCHLGESSCYCTPSNKKVLGGDIVQACVNDATAVGSASAYIQSFCATAGGSGGGGGGSSSTYTNPGGPMSPYSTSSTGYPTSTMLPPGNPGTLPSATPYPTTSTPTVVSPGSGYPTASTSVSVPQQSPYPTGGNGTTTAAATNGGGIGATPSGPSASSSSAPTGDATRHGPAAALGLVLAAALSGAFVLSL